MNIIVKETTFNSKLKLAENTWPGQSIFCQLVDYCNWTKFLFNNPHPFFILPQQ